MGELVSRTRAAAPQYSAALASTYSLKDRVVLAGLAEAKARRVGIVALFATGTASADEAKEGWTEVRRRPQRKPRPTLAESLRFALVAGQFRTGDREVPVVSKLLGGAAGVALVGSVEEAREQAKRFERATQPLALVAQKDMGMVPTHGGKRLWFILLLATSSGWSMLRSGAPRCTRRGK
eukprot:2839387-Amphidinium_carterae.1